MCSGAIPVLNEPSVSQNALVTLCFICNQQEDAISHYFFECLIASVAWACILPSFPSQSLTPNFAALWLVNLLNNPSLSKDQNSSRHQTMGFACWTIWLHHNQCNFHNSPPNHRAIIAIFHRCSKEWDALPPRVDNHLPVLGSTQGTFFVILPPTQVPFSIELMLHSLRSLTRQQSQLSHAPRRQSGGRFRDP